MIEIIIISLLLIAIGALIYFIKFKDKGMPKVGMKRENLSDYSKDYSDLKLYWTSISLIFLGVSVLIVIFILEILFS